jgi:hypothetical protein
MLNDKNMRVNSDRPRLVIAVNSSIAIGFLQGQLEYFQDRGFDATVLSPDRRKGEWEVARPEGVPIIEVPMEREIAPVRDVVSLWRLWRVMRALCPAVTNVGTPKAGLLGGLAAWLNRVPCRFYTLHGLRFETTKGLKRRLLIYAERLACRFAHRVICVSQGASCGFRIRQLQWCGCCAFRGHAKDDEASSRVAASVRNPCGCACCDICWASDL